MAVSRRRTHDEWASSRMCRWKRETTLEFSWPFSFAMATPKRQPSCSILGWTQDDDGRQKPPGGTSGGGVRMQPRASVRTRMPARRSGTGRDAGSTPGDNSHERAGNPHRRPPHTPQQPGQYTRIAGNVLHRVCEPVKCSAVWSIALLLVRSGWGCEDSPVTPIDSHARQDRQRVRARASSRPLAGRMIPRRLLKPIAQGRHPGHSVRAHLVRPHPHPFAPDHHPLVHTPTLHRHGSPLVSLWFVWLVALFSEAGRRFGARSSASGTRSTRATLRPREEAQRLDQDFLKMPIALRMAIRSMAPNTATAKRRMLPVGMMPSRPARK